MNQEGTRIQKFLSDNGVLSRRKAEEAIVAGKITVNGRPASIGQKIDPRRDLVAVEGVKVEPPRRKQNLYIMLHKPRGYVTTTSDEMGRRCVADLVKNAPQKVYPVGRLDKQSEGLLLLTNDGDFANKIMHPRSHVSKTYRVTVRADVTEDQLIKLSTGVMLDDKLTLPASVHLISKESGRSVMQLTIFEGRNRQVRRMCEGVGLTVVRLRRTAVGPMKLGMLQPGEWRELAPSELIALRASMKKSENRSMQEANEKIAEERRERAARGKNPRAKGDKPSYPKSDKPAYGKSDKPSYAKSGKPSYGKGDKPAYGKRGGK
jgi:23S rRNA pseudouridine2605 synthase